jgi:hypothetical protein
MAATEVPKQESTMSLIKFGFFTGLGSWLSLMVFIFIGLLFFIPGLIIVMKQNKKTKEERNKSLLVLGFVLMGLGVVVGMGMGLFLFSSLLIENIE